jgi:uncharacterized OB-fold protein
LADYKKPLPQATPETQEFWDGLKRGEFRLQRCNDASCARVYFPPRPFCPACGSRDVAWFTGSGKGHLHSYVLNYRPAPGFESDAPYAIAVVELDEGPRLMTSIVGADQTPEALPLDLRVELAPDAVTEDVTLPKFRPAGGVA